jgi:hypothetical protein
MKLTKSWLPVLGIYLIIGGMGGMILSTGSCICKDGSSWWILVGLLIGVGAWFFHQKTSYPIEENVKGRKEKNEKNI